jgi:hypothetical protein
MTSNTSDAQPHSLEATFTQVEFLCYCVNFARSAGQPERLAVVEGLVEERPPKLS